MSYKNIKEVFLAECPGLRADKQMFMTLVRLENDFVNKNQEHMEFFGGNLTGVNVVRFMQDDRNRLFTEILLADELSLETSLHELPTINKDFNVSSDVFNIGCIYLLHTIHHTNYLTDAQKQEAKIRVCLYMQYKLLCSILFNYFKFPANRETAKATYAMLSKKYALKIHGSWGATLSARAIEIINPNGIHAATIEKLDDLRVVYMINDIQGRLRDMMKNIYSVFMDIHRQGIKIVESSSTIELDGEVVVRDKKNSLAQHTRYALATLSDRHAWYKQELADIICDIIDTLYPAMLEKSLVWMSENYTFASDKISVQSIVSDIIEHAHIYFLENSNTIKNKQDLPGIMKRLKGVYMSSRSTDELLLSLRERTSDLIRASTHSKNESAINSARTALMLYVVLRTYTMHHYS